MSLLIMLKKLKELLKKIKSEKFMNGWLMLNKPKGFTSNYCLNVLKKKFNLKKTGYAGTLDPLATGLLPIAVGESTKSIKYFENLNKTYLFQVQWGAETTTIDQEGDIIKKNDIIPKKKSILSILNKFKGKILQTPPIYSAVKINGSRAYDLARKGLKFNIQPKEIFVNNIRLIKHDIIRKKSVFIIKCKTGCYVRSIVKDLANLLNASAYCTQIDRRRIGIFTQKRSLKLDFFMNIKKKEELKKFILDIPEVLYHIPKIKLDDKRLKLIKNGMKVSMYEEIGCSNFDNYIITSSKHILALGTVKAGYFYPKRILKV